MKAIYKIGATFRKMKFIKRTIFSLVAGFLTTLLFAVLFETAYYWMASHTSIVIWAGLGLSQFVLYKGDIDKMISSAVNNREAPMDPKKEAERQSTSEGERAEQPPANLEEETQDMGEAFAEVDGDTEDGEPLETLEDP